MSEVHAWVDESGSDRLRDPETYIVAASLCDHDRMTEVRRAMMPLLTRGHSKVHWRDETKHVRREAIAHQVEKCGIDHLVVVRNGVHSDTRRRPRNVALKRLLYELGQRDVRHAILESRGPADDQLDRRLHELLRRNREIRGVKMSHVPGPRDPGLWIADAVCGVISASRTGSPEYLEIISERVTVVTIDWRGL